MKRFARTEQGAFAAMRQAAQRAKLPGPAPALLLLLAVATACGPAVPQSRPESEPPPTRPSRTLVYATRNEPPTLASRVIGGEGTTLIGIQTVFNALIAYIDETTTPRPFIVETLPVLNSDSWRVFPDGRMATTYRLKTGLRWHDGAPASAEDFRFAVQFYTRPEFGLAGAPPFHAIDEVTVVDYRTVVIHWNRPYPDAGSLIEGHNELPILPAHILRAPLEELDAALFLNHPFWTREYVGLGPYRLDRWEAGSFLEGVAFDNYILGRPKIERVKVVFSPDQNATFASLLSGQVDIATDYTIGPEQTDIIRRQASDRFALQSGLGGAWRGTAFQRRTEYVSPGALLDPRVRAALAHGFDKHTVNDAAYLGFYTPADFLVHSQSRLGAAVERGAVKYPFDPQRSGQLMGEAGFVRSADGFYTSDAEGRLTIKFETTSSGFDVTAHAAIASGWRQLGFDIQESILPVAQTSDARLANTFPGMFTRTSFSNLAALEAYTTARVPRPETRWIGPNRGGWSNADYDQLAQAFTRTLDFPTRAEQVTQMARIFTADIAVISQFFISRPIPYAVELRGPKQNLPVDATWNYNIHEWEFR